MDKFFIAAMQLTTDLLSVFAPRAIPPEAGKAINIFCRCNATGSRPRPKIGRAPRAEGVFFLARRNAQVGKSTPLYRGPTQRTNGTGPRVRLLLSVSASFLLAVGRHSDAHVVDVELEA